MNTCEKCKFWLTTGNGVYGDCCRYPETVLKSSKQWCGEFQHACPHVKNV